MQCVSVCGSVRAVCDARATRLAPPRRGPDGGEDGGEDGRERFEDEGTLLIYEIAVWLLCGPSAHSSASGPITQESPHTKTQKCKVKQSL